MLQIPTGQSGVGYREKRDAAREAPVTTEAEGVRDHSPGVTGGNTQGVSCGHQAGFRLRGVCAPREGAEKGRDARGRGEAGRGSRVAAAAGAAAGLYLWWRARCWRRRARR